MVNPKKIDEKDLVVLNQPWMAEEKKSFSDYLKARKKTKTGSKTKRTSASKESGTNR